jgi:predicted RNA-binding Zn ribbon-like protein
MVGFGMETEAPDRVTQAPEPLGLVQRFLNTADLEAGADELADAAGARRWLVANRLLAGTDAFGEPDRELLVEVRETLRRLAQANRERRTDAAALRRLDEHASRAPLTVELRAGWAELVAASPGVDGAVARLLAVVFTAVRDGTWSRLKACRNDACRWVFYDASRNRVGTWCSMAVCGNRHNVRAFRARRSGGAV